MKTPRFVVVLTVLMVIAFATSASAQGASRPGMVISGSGGGGGGGTSVPPMPIKPTGLEVQVMSYYGMPISGATVTISLVHQDAGTGEWFADHSTSKKFGKCEAAQVVDCIRKDGRGTISNPSLPPSDNPYDSWRVLDVRAEANGFVHHLTSVVWVGTDGDMIVTAPTIYMYESGFATSDAYAWYTSDRIIAVGLWARQNWDENVIVDFSFKGSSWTKVQVDYGTTYSTSEQVGPNGVWIIQEFWAPQNATASYGGSVCGTIQVRSAYEAESVKAQTKEVCVKLRRPSVVPVPVGKGF